MGDCIGVLGISKLLHGAQKVEGECHYEDVLEVVPIAIGAEEEEQVSVFWEVATVSLLFDVLSHKVRVVVQQEHCRGQVVADVPNEAHHRPPFSISDSLLLQVD